MDEPLRELLFDGAASLGVTLDTVAMERFSTYLVLLQLWGKKINLTTRLGSEEVIVYHFLDSLAGAPVLAESPAARIVDLGAGAGFPALPLKIHAAGTAGAARGERPEKSGFLPGGDTAAGAAGIEAMLGQGRGHLGVRSEHHRRTIGP